MANWACHAKVLSNDNEEDQTKVGEELNSSECNKWEKKHSRVKKRLPVKPHQKRKVISSQTQALSQITRGMTQMPESQAKRDKSYIDFDREQDKFFIEFK